MEGRPGAIADAATLASASSRRAAAGAVPHIGKPPRDLVGALLAQFRVVELLGEGGIGVVYKAEDVKLRRFVALKVLSTRLRPGADSRLLREARAAAAVTSAHIAAIYDLCDANDISFIVMEYVDGVTLRAKIAEGALEAQDARILARDVAAGLASAHARGVVHRDLKPENVMVTRGGRAKILDFGLAKLSVDPLTASDGSSLVASAALSSEPHRVRATPEYLSPEQALGGAVDARSDVFSFGVLLHEVLTGQRPFPEGRSLRHPCQWGASEWMRAPSRFHGSVPRDLARVASRCLELDRTKRFVDGSELLAALAEEPGPARAHAVSLLGPPSPVGPEIEVTTASAENDDAARANVAARSRWNDGLPIEGDLLAGKYRVERILGRGGMGVVYSAHHELLKQRVALKLLAPDQALNGEAVPRFLNEARIAARIQSEHVGRVMDVGLLDTGIPFLVLELLDGSDLAQLLDEHGPLSVTSTVDYLLQALEAIVEAHGLGVIHRDIKPSNLFLARRNDRTSQIKVLDFGVSKLMTAGQGDVESTSSKSLLGSPAYMAPEQLRSSKAIDARADIWSLGVVAYELLTRTRPFHGDTVVERFAKIQESEPVPIGQLRPDVPAALGDVIMRCLRRNPDERFRSAGGLARALAPFASPATATQLARIDRLEPCDAATTLPSNIPLAPAQRIVTNASGVVSALGFAQTSPPSSQTSAPMKTLAKAIAVACIALALAILGLRAARPEAQSVRSATASSSAAASSGAAPPASGAEVARAQIPLVPTPVPPSTSSSPIVARPPVPARAAPSGHPSPPRGAIPAKAGDPPKSASSAVDPPTEFFHR